MTGLFRTDFPPLGPLLIEKITPDCPFLIFLRAGADARQKAKGVLGRILTDMHRLDGNAERALGFQGEGGDHDAVVAAAGP